MPSPRWPSRAITSRSTTLRLDEKFAIAVAAHDRRGDDAAHAPAARGDELCDAGADRGMQIGVAHDALLDRAASRLELRLDQRDQSGAFLEERFHGRQDQPERDETHVDAGEIRLLCKPRGIQRANVGVLDRNDSLVAAQPRVKLSAADVDRIDAPRAALKQDVRETAGRSADIETDAVLHIESELVERRRELETAARNIRMYRLGLDGRRIGDF